MCLITDPHTQLQHARIAASENTSEVGISNRAVRVIKQWCICQIERLGAELDLEIFTDVLRSIQPQVIVEIYAHTDIRLIAAICAQCKRRRNLESRGIEPGIACLRRRCR